MTVQTIEAFEHEMPEDEALARLLELGREQGYVSIDDVLQVVPGEQRQAVQLEQIFETLLSAGIPLSDDDEPETPQNGKAGEKVDEGKEYAPAEEPLAEAEVNDLVRLYFNETASVPLLTSEEEVK